jgi:hypothetical protein
MKRKMAVLIGILGGCTLSFGQCVNAKGTHTAISVHVSISHDAAVSGAPVIVSVTETNISDQGMSVWRQRNGSFGVEVRNDQGALASDTEIGKYKNGHVDLSQLDPKEVSAHTGGSGACMTLNPSESVTEAVNVGQLYDIHSPGRYLVVAYAIL